MSIFDELSPDDLRKVIEDQNDLLTGKDYKIRLLKIAIRDLEFKLATKDYSRNELALMRRNEQLTRQILQLEDQLSQLLRRPRKPVDKQTRRRNIGVKYIDRG